MKTIAYRARLTNSPSVSGYLTEKGKPTERWRRKVSGLTEFSYGSGTASFVCRHVFVSALPPQHVIPSRYCAVPCCFMQTVQRAHACIRWLGRDCVIPIWPVKLWISIPSGKVDF